MKLLVLFLIGFSIYYGLNRLQEKAYQAQAIKCVENPDRPSCDTFNTAAGHPEKE